MIKTKHDLIEYLEADKKALGRTGRHPLFWDTIWKYERALRYCEYYKNMSKNFFTWGLYLYWRYKYYRLGERTSFTIPPNCFGKGLSIAHIGPIIVNGGGGDRRTLPYTCWRKYWYSGWYIWLCS